MRSYPCLFVAVALLMPFAALAANNKPLFETTTSTQTSGSRSNSVAKSNAQGNPAPSEMPLKGLQATGGQLLDADKDGIPDARDSKIGIPNPFAPQEQEQKPKKKQVYKGTVDMELHRPIKDDRIDDGYVQGLIQQRAPH